MELCTYKINVRGTVQGVGFRPFVYALSQRYICTGTVTNNADGVEIFINTDTITLQQFLTALEYESPLLASIQSIEYTEVEYKKFDDFQIIQTKSSQTISVNIPPDVSICSECEKELFDPLNRRYNYPFITCTHCGVRYSIIYDLPYDRERTSMKFFKMCALCEEEYNNPLDRRYHAQPIGCHDCGAQLTLLDIDTVVRLLKEGNILAVKGVGGYHLMCDASNPKAVQKLRKRKKRVSKPFAVMVKNITIAKDFAEVNEREEALLISKERPIVLLKTKEESRLDLVHPQSSYIGLFLPYTPLHLLILDKLDRPLIATSANVTDEPICTSLSELKNLEGVYDYVLDHNREIVNGCDDSVVMVVNNQTIVLRRARGFTPVSITLPFTLKQNVLALGANQKSSIAIGFENQVILSPHIGDLNSIGSLEYYKNNIDSLQRMYKFRAKTLAYDLHSQYESSKIAQELLLSDTALVSQKVQHHHAHILSVMAQKNLSGKVFGVAFDGTGLGDDGKLWGGEFMLCDYEGYERVAHINYFKLLGGAKAIKEPRRVALSLLFDIYGQDTLSLKNPTVDAFSKTELSTYFLAWKKGLNAPESSSVGRLFDAIASLLGVCQEMSYEGESGMLLEELYDATIVGSYSFEYKDAQVNILSLVSEILQEKDIRVATTKFFHTLVDIIDRVYTPYNLPLVLSGGVFQNRVLLSLVLDKFPQAIISNTIPPNDGGIALGQAVAQINDRKENE